MAGAWEGRMNRNVREEEEEEEEETSVVSKNAHVEG
jgi:hypothetical protein